MDSRQKIAGMTEKYGFIPVFFTGLPAANTVRFKTDFHDLIDFS
jgi:hypothetical protein